MKIVPVVIAVIKNKDKYLLTKRVEFDDEDRDFAPYAWNMPGGGMEFGETPEQSLNREIKEELSINIHIKSLVPEIFTEVRRQWQGLFLVYICEMTDASQKIVLNEEAGEYGWFTMAEVRKLKTVPKTVEILTKAIKIGLK